MRTPSRFAWLFAFSLFAAAWGFAAPLPPVRVNAGGSVKQIRVCTRCLKANKVQKAGPRVIAAAAS